MNQIPKDRECAGLWASQQNNCLLEAEHSRTAQAKFILHNFQRVSREVCLFNLQTFSFALYLFYSKKKKTRLEVT